MIIWGQGKRKKRKVGDGALIPANYWKLGGMTGVADLGKPQRGGVRERTILPRGNESERQ